MQGEKIPFRVAVDVKPACGTADKTTADLVCKQIDFTSRADFAKEKACDVRRPTRHKQTDGKDTIYSMERTTIVLRT